MTIAIIVSIGQSKVKAFVHNPVTVVVPVVADLLSAFVGQCILVVSISIIENIPTHRNTGIDQVVRVPISITIKVAIHGGCI